MVFRQGFSSPPEYSWQRVPPFHRHRPEHSYGFYFHHDSRRSCIELSFTITKPCHCTRSNPGDRLLPCEFTAARHSHRPLTGTPRPPTNPVPDLPPPEGAPRPIWAPPEWSHCRLTGTDGHVFVWPRSIVVSVAAHLCCILGDAPRKGAGEYQKTRDFSEETTEVTDLLSLAGVTNRQAHVQQEHGDGRRLIHRTAHLNIIDVNLPGTSLGVGRIAHANDQ